MKIREDIIDIDDDEYNECESDMEREALLLDYWRDWSNNFIDGGWEIIDD